MVKSFSAVCAMAVTLVAAQVIPAMAQDDDYWRDCEQQREQNEALGTLGGAIAGGLIGHGLGHHGGRAGATIAGVVIGGAIGHEIGKSLPCDDRGYAYRSYGEGLDGEAGEKYSWHNDASGDHGYIIPGEIYHDHNGNECRDFHQVIVVHGDRSEMDGTACRQEDGRWAVMG